MNKDDQEAIFKEAFGFDLPWDPEIKELGMFIIDFEAFEKGLEEKDSGYDGKECNHVMHGEVSMSEYIYIEYGEAAANLIDELT